MRIIKLECTITMGVHADDAIFAEESSFMESNACQVLVTQIEDIRSYYCGNVTVHVKEVEFID